MVDPEQALRPSFSPTTLSTAAESKTCLVPHQHTLFTLGLMPQDSGQQCIHSLVTRTGNPMLPTTAGSKPFKHLLPENDVNHIPFHLWLLLPWLGGSYHWRWHRSVGLSRRGKCNWNYTNDRSIKVDDYQIFHFNCW